MGKPSAAKAKVVSSAADGDAVRLTSSSALRENTPRPLFDAPRAAVSGWTVEDVQQHVFLLVWVCGVPVHVRYVTQLLQHSAMGRSASDGASPAAYIAAAQRDVMRTVYERGRKVDAGLCAWPTTQALAPRPPTLSFLVPLGVAEVAPADVEAKTGARTTKDGEEEDKKACSRGSRTASRTEGAGSLSAPPASAVQAVAVAPDAAFSNVTALALYAPAEGEASRGTATSPQPPSSLPFPVPVDPAWCSRAYWTAVSQAKQWADRFLESDTAQGAAPHRQAGPALPPSTLTPASSAPVQAAEEPQPERKRQRGNGGATPARVETVIVDAEDDVVEDVKAGKSHAGAAVSSTTKADTAIIIIDSDDE